METQGSRAVEWREGRRLGAWEWGRDGRGQRAIAEALGVTGGAVSRWMRRAGEGGVEAPRRRLAPGPTPKLTDEQRDGLPALLAPGAAAFGVRGEVWTAKRVAAVIRREVGVRSHPDHVGKLLRAAGRSVRRPVERAGRRDEAAIEAWYAARRPALGRGLTGRDGPSSGSTSPPPICPPAPSGPTPPAGRPRPCACR